VNNDEGNISMSGSDATITIPALVSKFYRREFNYKKWQVVSKCQDTNKMQPLWIQTVILIMEFVISRIGHGISTRLGGGNISLQNKRSNGRRLVWLVCFMMQLKPGDIGAAKENWNFCFF
jgi:hypothetical protein